MLKIESTSHGDVPVCVVEGGPGDSNEMVVVGTFAPDIDKTIHPEDYPSQARGAGWVAVGSTVEF